MNARISTERLFSLASFEGLKLIKRYAARQPDVDISELLKLIEKVDADGASLDLEASAYLGKLVGADCPMDGIEFYQTCIKAVLVKHQPLWAKSMRSGRKRFVEKLNKNDQDLFTAAGLMDNPPPPDVVLWWDDVAGHARLISDAEKMEQARAAEMLSLEHEIERLGQLGINKQPEWLGLDDNFAGYDVLSYDSIGNKIVVRMIEVKSTIASPLRFIITRNEWKQAEDVGNFYLFHIWDMAKNPAELHLRTVEEVAPHIPSDNKKGNWSTAQIPLGI